MVGSGSNYFWRVRSVSGGSEQDPYHRYQPAEHSVAAGGEAVVEGLRGSLPHQLVHLTELGPVHRDIVTLHFACLGT